MSGATVNIFSKIMLKIFDLRSAFLGLFFSSSAWWLLSIIVRQSVKVFRAEL